VMPRTSAHLCTQQGRRGQHDEGHSHTVIVHIGSRYHPGATLLHISCQ
jgi:hypothetical protein